jgi:hypothetical protein
MQTTIFGWICPYQLEKVAPAHLFALAGFITLFIALFTVSFKCVKAALRNKPNDYFKSVFIHFVFLSWKSSHQNHCQPKIQFSL